MAGVGGGSGEYAPRGRVEVVGAVAEVVDESERGAPECEEKHTARGIEPRERLSAQVCDGGGEVDLRFRKCAATERGGEGECLRRDEFFALEGAEFHSGVDKLQSG